MAGENVRPLKITVADAFLVSVLGGSGNRYEKAGVSCFTPPILQPSRNENLAPGPVKNRSLSHRETAWQYLRFSTRKTTTSGTAGMRPWRGLTPTHSIRRPASLDHQAEAPRNQALHGRPSLRILAQRRFTHRLLHFKPPHWLIRHRRNCFVNVNRHLHFFAHSIAARKDAPHYSQKWRQHKRSDANDTLQCGLGLPPPETVLDGLTSLHPSPPLFSSLF